MGMELKDTVEMMCSDDYTDRFIAEVDQLSIRLNNLKIMVEKWDAGTLDFTPTCEREVYDRQIAAMQSYLDILKERAEVEGIAC